MSQTNHPNRARAAKRDETRYFTGRACRNGHVDGRFVATGKCVGCHREAVARYRARLKAEEQSE